MNGGKKFLTPPQGRASPQDLIEYERARTEFIMSRKRYTDISSRIPHTDKIRDLFQKWAPFYDTYMRLTNHEGAAREVIRQLTAMGYFKNQRVFMGKGMDLGGGTGYNEGDRLQGAPQGACEAERQPAGPPCLEFHREMP